MAWRKFEDLSGQTFGRLTVLFREESASKQVVYRCVCKCGTEKSVKAPKLKSGNTRSCGCYNIDCRIKYDHSNLICRTPEYLTYHGMLQRCHNPNHKGWYRYGGRGISVCERWRNSFQAFYDDMGPRPSDKHSLDRIDNDGNYCPENCRWATIVVQMNNRNINHTLTHNGETLTIMQWSRRFGVPETTIHTRLSKGWPVGAAISLSPDRGRKWTDRISEIA